MLKPSDVSKNRVIIAAGDQRWDSWIVTQQTELDLLEPETFKTFFGAERASALLCEHAWEHLSIEEGVAAARTCFNFVIPGGRLRVAVPDGRFPNTEYQRTVQVGGPGPADHPAAGHKVLYVAESLSVVFEEAGFSVTLLEWWDSNGMFNTVAWRIEDGPIYRSVSSITATRRTALPKVRRVSPASFSTRFARFTEPGSGP